MKKNLFFVLFFLTGSTPFLFSMYENNNKEKKTRELWIDETKEAKNVALQRYIQCWRQGIDSVTLVKETDSNLLFSKKFLSSHRDVLDALSEKKHELCIQSFRLLVEELNIPDKKDDLYKAIKTNELKEFKKIIANYTNVILKNIEYLTGKYDFEIKNMWEKHLKERKSSRLTTTVLKSNLDVFLTKKLDQKFFNDKIDELLNLLEEGNSFVPSERLRLPFLQPLISIAFMAYLLHVVFQHKIFYKGVPAYVLLVGFIICSFTKEPEIKNELDECIDSFKNLKFE